MLFFERKNNRRAETQVIIVIMVIHRPADGSDTQWAAFRNSLTPTPLQHKLGVQEFGKFHKSEDTPFAFQKIDDLWKEVVHEAADEEDDRLTPVTTNPELLPPNQDGPKDLSHSYHYSPPVTRARAKCPPMIQPDPAQRSKLVGTTSSFDTVYPIQQGQTVLHLAQATWNSHQILVPRRSSSFR